MTTIYVFGRRMSEMDDYIKVCRQSGDYEGVRFIPVTGATTLAGTRRPLVHLIGYYNEHRNWGDVEFQLDTRDAQVKVVGDWR